MISTKVGLYLESDILYKEKESLQTFWKNRMPFDLKYDYTYDAIIR